jgi:hypothetical protein
MRKLLSFLLGKKSTALKRGVEANDRELLSPDGPLTSCFAASRFLAVTAALLGFGLLLLRAPPRQEMPMAFPAHSRRALSSCSLTARRGAHTAARRRRGKPHHPGRRGLAERDDRHHDGGGRIVSSLRLRTNRIPLCTPWG